MLASRSNNALLDGGTSSTSSDNGPNMSSMRCESLASCLFSLFLRAFAFSSAFLSLLLSFFVRCFLSDLILSSLVVSNEVAAMAVDTAAATGVVDAFADSAA